MDRLDERGDHRVVLQVEPDAGELANRPDPVPGELVERTDTGEQQQLRRVYGAAGKDHFAPAAGDFLLRAPAVGNTDGACAIEQHTRDVGAGGDGEVRAPQRGTQIGVRGRPAPAPMLCDGRQANAFEISRSELLDRAMPACTAAR